MQRRNLHKKPRQIASRHGLSRWPEIKANTYPLRYDANRPSSGTADAALEFGHFRVLLRQRQLLADGIPVELGRRAFDPRNGSARDPRPYRRRGYRQRPRRGRRPWARTARSQPMLCRMVEQRAHMSFPLRPDRGRAGTRSAPRMSASRRGARCRRRTDGAPCAGRSASGTRRPARLTRPCIMMT